MQTVEIDYKGSLRNSCTHLKSGTNIETDAPVDNNGKGEAFSPTDLVATAYGSCMMTIIGIYCDQNGLEFVNGNCKVTKEMTSSPRRISKLIVELDLKGNAWNEDVQKRIKNAALNCPVAKSISDQIIIESTFEF